MDATRTGARRSLRCAAMASTKATSKPRTATRKPAPAGPKAASKAATKPKARMTLAETMKELEKAGSAQTRKTYARHGAQEPMFGVSFATLKALMKQIGVDHELALELWGTGNFDARNLAVKIVDPARLSATELDRWVRDGSSAPMCGGYVPTLAAEASQGPAKLEKWLGAKDAGVRAAGWTLLAHLAMRDEGMADDVFESRLEQIERTIHAAPNAERDAMNQAVIAVGCRNQPLRKAALAAAKRIGKVEIDHGDTACKTPDARESIEKAWAHSTGKGYDSPAAHERSRAVPRLRC